jgi:hypothetical protein
MELARVQCREFSNISAEFPVPATRVSIKFWVQQEKIPFHFPDIKQISNLWNNLWSPNQVISIDFKLSSSVTQDAKTGTVL